MMAQILVQPTDIPSVAVSRRLRSGNVKRIVTMMCALRPAAYQMSSFSGLSVDALDKMARPKQNSLAIVATSSRHSKASRCVPNTTIELFTEQAIEVIMLAQKEAMQLDHKFVGTEHILLGLIGEETGIPAKVLKSMGINLKDARAEVEKIIGRGSGFVAGEIPFTPRAERVLDLPLKDVNQLGSNFIGSEHLFLALLREHGCVAARVLENLGKDPSYIERKVIRVIVSPVPVRMADGVLVSRCNETYLTKIPEEFRELCDREIEILLMEPQHSLQLPEEPTELEKQLWQITKEMHEAVRCRDYEKAGELRDRKWDLRAEIRAAVDRGKGMSQEDSKARDVGPPVTEVDIQHIVSSRIEEVSTNKSDLLRDGSGPLGYPPIMGKIRGDGEHPPL